jgi:hypothetical protein
VKHLLVIKNPQTPLCCHPEPVLVFGFFHTKKMNHAMNNYSLKISSTSYEVNTPLDSNEENITNHFHSLHGAPLPAFAEN